MSTPNDLTPTPSPNYVPGHIDPRTTEQQNLTTAGQRRVNLIWEYTQAIVAIAIVASNIAVWIVTAMKGLPMGAPEGLTNALFLVVGFYFSRTNHSAIGGVGQKPWQEYMGR